jgi:hypothetical protein
MARIVQANRRATNRQITDKYNNGVQNGISELVGPCHGWAITFFIFIYYIIFGSDYSCVSFWVSLKSFPHLLIVQHLLTVLFKFLQAVKLIVDHCLDNYFQVLP